MLPPTHSRSDLGLGRNLTGASLEDTVDSSTARTGDSERRRLQSLPVTAVGSYRVIFAYDPVPHVPPPADDEYTSDGALITPGYWHTEDYVWASGQDDTSVCLECPGAPTDSECVCAAAPTFKRLYDRLAPSLIASMRAIKGLRVAEAVALFQGLVDGVSWSDVVGLVQFVLGAMREISTVASCLHNPMAILLEGGCQRFLAVVTDVTALVIAVARIGGEVVRGIKDHMEYGRMFRVATPTPPPAPSATPLTTPQALAGVWADGAGFIQGIVAEAQAADAALDGSQTGATQPQSTNFTGYCAVGTDVSAPLVATPNWSPVMRCMVYRRPCNATSAADGLCNATEVAAGAVRTVYSSADVPRCLRMAMWPGIFVGLRCCADADGCNALVPVGGPTDAPSPPGTGGGAAVNATAATTGQCYVAYNGGANLTVSRPVTFGVNGSCFIAAVHRNRSQELMGVPVNDTTLPTRDGWAYLRMAVNAEACDNLDALRALGYRNPTCCNTHLCNLIAVSTPSGTPSSTATPSQSPSPSATGSASGTPTATPSQTPTPTNACPPGWFKPADSAKCFKLVRATQAGSAANWQSLTTACANAWPGHTGGLASITSDAEAVTVVTNLCNADAETRNWLRANRAVIALGGAKWGRVDAPRRHSWFWSDTSSNGWLFSPGADAYWLAGEWRAGGR